MHVDYIIVGQGISGTWLSYFLNNKGKTCLVIDKNDPASASRIAAGIINPVTGRRHVTAWMIEDLLPFCKEIYQELGNSLSIEVLAQKDIIDFFPSPQMRVSFTERSESDDQYITIGTDESIYRKHFNFDFGWGKVSPVYMVQLDQLLPAWRKKLDKDQALLEEDFDILHLKLTGDSVTYKDITAEKIIFCDGVNGLNHSFFQKLPFAFNKGEMLLIEIPDLPPSNIYKRGLMLAPVSDGLWWAGSNYEWDYTDDAPTIFFRENTEKLLKNWLKIPFKVRDHKAALRPATVERRPFVGLHPQHRAIGILNGMGTKGCSLAPYFAKEFAEYLIAGTSIHPEAEISRFSRLLTN